MYYGDHPNNGDPSDELNFGMSDGALSDMDSSMASGYNSPYGMMPTAAGGNTRNRGPHHHVPQAQQNMYQPPVGMAQQQSPFIAPQPSFGTYGFYSPPVNSPYGMGQANIGAGGPSPFPIDPALLYGIGSQIIGTHTTAQFQNFQEKSKTWMSQKLKYYFAVDTGYVLKKLALLFFPYTHRDWSSKYSNSSQANVADGSTGVPSAEEIPVAPRDDLNSPDLYIPCMAFVTYVLVAGFLLGTNESFSPERLGIEASTALGWILFEVLFTLVSLYLLSINCCLGFFHLLSYSGYKFVPMIGALVISYLMNSTAYYGFLLYSSLSISFFLVSITSD